MCVAVQCRFVDAAEIPPLLNESLHSVFGVAVDRDMGSDAFDQEALARLKSQGSRAQILEFILTRADVAGLAVDIHSFRTHMQIVLQGITREDIRILNVSMAFDSERCLVGFVSSVETITEPRIEIMIPPPSERK
jgi:hypothetical protein